VQPATTTLIMRLAFLQSEPLTEEEVMNIEYWRTEIDEIDRELLRLLNRRARLAMKVGMLKSAAGLPCCDPEREQSVLQRLQQANPGPLAEDAVTKVFRRIIRESRRMEEHKVAEVNGNGNGKGASIQEVML
jgi:chorismate mutase-like protein